MPTIFVSGVNFEALKASLELLVLGWDGGFLVLGIIALASLALCRIFPPKRGGSDD